MSFNEFKLDDICEVINGGSWNQKEYVSQGVKVIKVSNLVNDGIDSSNLSFLPFEAISKYKKHILKAYDLVVTTVGSHPQLVASAAGRGFIIPKDFEGALLNQNIVCIRSKDSNVLNDKFLGFLGKSDDFRHYIQQTGRGAANQMRIPISSIKNFVCSLPNLDTQKKIANILSNYDDLIENNLKRIKLLEEAAQNIYKEWFVNFRFPNHENTPIDEETGLPETWKLVRFSELYTLNNGYAFKSVDYKTAGCKILRTRDYSSTFFVEYDSPIFLDKDLIGKYSKYQVQNLDLLIIMVGASIGKYGLILENNLPALQNQNQWAIRVKEGYEDYNYYRLYNVIGIIKQLLAKRTGAARDFFRASFLKELEVIKPSSEIVLQYEKKVKPIFKQLDTLQNMNRELKEARDILLPRLMNRTIEV